MYVYALPATGIIAAISEYDKAENTLANAAKIIDIMIADPAPAPSEFPTIALPLINAPGLISALESIIQGEIIVDNSLTFAVL